jgi:hypothetical protein
MAPEPVGESLRFWRASSDMHHRNQNKLCAFIVVALCGGTLFGTCTARLHDSIIDGTQVFILSLLDPSNIIINGD